MTLSYPNPSLSEMAEGSERLGSTVDEASQEQARTPSPSMSTPIRRILLTVIILSGLMFSCLDTSIVSTALFTISVDFDNYQDAPWTILGYLLTYMSFAVGLSKLSDIYGRRNLLAVSWVLFSGFSIWCALAGNMNQLIAARALQGIGGSGLYSLAQVCLIEQGPNRPEVVGALVGITLSISYILGPLLGGAISNWTWRGVFWINVPFGTVALIGIYTLWPEERRKKYDAWTAISKIDFIGNMLLVVASILLVFSIQEGGSFVWSWSSPVIIWSLVVSGVCWVLLALWESYLFYGKCQVIQPIFPLRLAMGRVYLSGLIVTLLTGFVYISLVIKIPERLQVIYGDNALQAGIHLLPLLGPCAFGSFLGGVLSKKQNLTSQTLMAGCALQALGIGLVYGLAQPESRLHLLLGFTAIYGLGVGLCFSACTIIAAIEARFADFAAAQGAVAQARVFGGALGLAACTIVFNENLRRALGSSSPSSSGGGLTDEQQLGQIQHGPVVLAPQASGVADSVIRRVHLAAFKEEMLVMTVFAVVAVVVSLVTYKSKPALVAQTIAHHKESASRASDTELETTSSVRSLIR